METRPHLVTVLALILSLTTLAACGGGRGLDVSVGQPVDVPSTIVHAQTGTLPKIAYAGSPVLKSRAYINSSADEPGETWLGLGDIGEIPAGDGYTLSAYESQRVVPYLIFDYAPGHRPDPELEAQVHRAFKLWTRHLTGIRGTDDRLWHTVVEVGHTNACGGDAGVLACVLPINHYENQYVVPIIQIPASQAELVARANSPISLLSTLAHEAGHALDYRHASGYYNPETGQFDKQHAPSSAGQLMSPIQGDSVTIGPQTADLFGVRHSFTYGTALSADHFGWWIDAPPTSYLRSFGSGVVRHFDVADIASVSQVVASSDSVTSASVTSDYVKVSSWVDGFPSSPEYLDYAIAYRPADWGLGSATWTGGLLAVDLVDYSPVIGDASLSMDFSALRLTAEFDNFQQGPDFDAWDGPSSLSYTLTENAYGVWHDRLGRVDARFFAEVNASGELTDPAYTVAGHLDDDQALILGAYAATRD